MIWISMLNFANFYLFHMIGQQAFLCFGTFVAQMWPKGSQENHFPSYIGYGIVGMSLPGDRGSQCEQMRKLRKFIPVVDQRCFP